ncbi:MAG: hypothetical protein MUE72_02840 [Chitinophagaceae bacterium]|jgi:hypothetical protein|nr:hypothetical protein [Chitinophagaceae bacterium]
MSLKKDVADYKKLSLPLLEKMKEYYEKLTLPSAIQNAAKGIDYHGKVNSHQWRVKIVNREEGANKLAIQEEEISNCKTFEQVFVIVEEVRKNTNGLGNLWSYDTALRISFNKHLYPKKVYIQAGVVKGLKKLGMAIPDSRSLEKNKFSSELQILEPYQIEGFLCVCGR